MRDDTKFLRGKKAVFIIANRNFRDEEYLEPRKILAEAGVDVTVASSALVEAQGRFGTKVRPDILVSAIEVNDFDAVVFIGGDGSSEYWGNPVAHKLARDAVSQGKVLAAICVAPVTLANAGVLEGKKATVFPSEIDQLRKAGAKYTGNKVENDGLTVTADGPESAKRFGEKIRDLLSTQ